MTRLLRPETCKRQPMRMDILKMYNVKNMMKYLNMTQFLIPETWK